jgi:phosphate/sulfate permease
VTTARERRLLLVGLTLYVGTYFLHGIVHVVRRMTPMVTVMAGWALLAAAAGVLVAAWRGRPSAMATLVVSGLGGGGLASVHLLPIWGPFAEQWDASVHLVWWMSLFLALFGAVWAAAVACYVLRCERTRRQSCTYAPTGSPAG